MPQGNGTVSFDVPQFNGSMRVMAVAFAGDKFGNAEKNLFVREPIVLTPTFPRFIGSTDELTIPVSVYNGTGADATFNVDLSATGPVKIVDGGNRVRSKSRRDVNCRSTTKSKPNRRWAKCNSNLLPMATARVLRRKRSWR